MYHPRRDEPVSAGSRIVLALERTAVYALLVGRVLLMRSYLYAVERAEVLVAAVMLAVVYRALDTMIGIIVIKHNISPQIYLSVSR